MDDDVIMDVDIEFLFTLVGDELAMMPFCEEGISVRHPFIFYTDNLFSPSVGSYEERTLGVSYG